MPQLEINEKLYSSMEKLSALICLLDGRVVSPLELCESGRPGLKRILSDVRNDVGRALEALEDQDNN